MPTKRDERRREHLPLTSKQQHFARCVASGMSQADAYREAYSVKEGAKPSGVQANAGRLAKDTRVAQLITHLTQKKVDAMIHGAVEDAAYVRQKLRQWVETAEPVDSNRIRAAELLGKAAGMFSQDINLNDRRDRSAAEIERELEERLAALMGRESTGSTTDNSLH